jgi:hypothetical protein
MQNDGEQASNESGQNTPVDPSSGLNIDPGSNQEEANDLGPTPVDESSDPFQGHLFEGQIESNVVSYQLIWRGSPNYWAGRKGQSIVAICDHIMQSSIESADSWFKNSASEVSAHFGVARDGRIYQWVRTENTAWANGIVNRANTGIGWLADAIRRGLNPNYLTLSIEHEGLSGQAFPETQYQATLWLHRHLVDGYGVTPDRQHIIGHNQIDSVSRANCPGSAFPWDRLFNDLRATGGGGTGIGGGSTLIRKDVPGLIMAEFGPGVVTTNNTYVRSYPGFGADVAVVRKLAAGTNLRFVGYTDEGGAFHDNTRWYLIDPADGDGWIHSSMVN